MTPTIGEAYDGYGDIEIPEELLITDLTDPIDAIVQSTYPSLLKHFQDGDFLRSRPILASTIQVVDEINNYILNLISGNSLIYILFEKMIDHYLYLINYAGDQQEYFNTDSIDRSEANDNDVFEQVTTEFLNCLQTSACLIIL